MLRGKHAPALKEVWVASLSFTEGRVSSKFVCIEECLGSTRICTERSPASIHICTEGSLGGTIACEIKKPTCNRKALRTFAWG